MRIMLKNPVNLGELFKEQGITGLDFVSMSIGFDGKAYFLFSSKIPPRIDGIFVDTVANAAYTAVVVTPSWKTGTVEEAERIELGRHAMNFSFLRPVPDGSFLLLGSRCMYSKKKGPEKNAVFVDREGKVLRSLTFGDGIADCAVREDGVIITSYFDEGIMGNYGWEEPIGYAGLCVWNPDGEIIWRPERDMIDCYAINTDAVGNLWYYYYDDFYVIHTDFKTETEFDPEVEGADRLVIAGNALIMDGGYDDPDSYYVSRIDGDQIREKEPLEFALEDGTIVLVTIPAFNGAKTLVMTEDGCIHFVDFSGMK